MHDLDHNATSALRPEAREAMTRALDLGGNASSVHARGRAARAMVEKAREQVAALAGARPSHVIFTSGGTESANLALWGAVEGAIAQKDAKDGSRITRLFVSAIEHDCIRATAADMAERVPGLRTYVIPVTADGVIDTEALRVLLREGKGHALIAVMAANNETGVVQPLSVIAALAAEVGALLLVDASQAAGKIAFDASVADYLILSSHKIGGPIGAGALIVRDGVPLMAQLLGGGQERGLRAGTENAPAIAGFGAAAEAAKANMPSAALRDGFETELKQMAPGAVIFGAGAPRLPNTCNFALPGIDAQTALVALDLDGVLVSSGSACSSGKVKPSHVLAAMGVGEEIARCALRVSFGWNSTKADADAALAAIRTLLARKTARAAA